MDKYTILISEHKTSPFPYLTLHITTNGVNRLCGIANSSGHAGHIFYYSIGSSFIDGKWCKECENKLNQMSDEEI